MKTWKNIEDVHQGLDEIWKAMDDCIARGCRREGTLPGGLRVKEGLARYINRLSRPEAALAIR